MPAISGIDWAAEWHDVRVAQTDSGELLVERRFAHDEAGVAALIELLVSHRVARVAIERPEGLLVGRLLAAGIRVLAIHPNQLAAARDRFRAAAGKSDRFDAFVLCELCRTDQHRFAALAPSGDETIALQALLRTREDLVAVRVQLANQLRAQLDCFWPGAKCIFADIDSPIALAFLARYPSPAAARGLGPKRLAAFLARNAYSGRRPVSDLLDRLRSAPLAAIGELEHDARHNAVAGLVAALTPIVAQIGLLTSQIAGAVRAHPDGPIFLSFFRDPKSVITAAGLLAEIGDNRARYPTADSLAADAGQAPVATPPSAGPATSACATTSAYSPTPPATGTPGPTTPTPAPPTAAPNTPTPPASSAAPGPACCGAAGKTTPPTTPHDTATSPGSSNTGVDTGRLIPAAARAGLTGVGFHTLRHSARRCSSSPA
jgi:transposase